MDGLEDVLHMFPHVVHMSCSDRAASNLKAESSAEFTRRTSELRLHTTCAIHKAYSAHRALQEVDRAVVSGMLNTSLSMRSAGALACFRRGLALLLLGRLRIIKMHPPAEDTRQGRYRAAVIDRFLGPDEGTRGLQRSVTLCRILNGDWSQPHVQHYCPEGCCINEAETHARLCFHVVEALLPRAAPNFPRSRWTGANLAVNFSGLLAAVHGCLSSLLGPCLRELSDASKPVVASDFALPPAGHALQAFVGAEAAGDSAAEDDDDLGPRGFGIVVGGDEAAGDEDVVDAHAPTNPAGQQGETDWAERNRQARVGAQEFSQLPELRGRLAVLRRTMACHVTLMSRMLRVCGHEWEEAALEAARTPGAPPRFRLLEAACGVETTVKFLNECESLLFSNDWEDTPLSERSTLLSLIAFRQISSGAAAAVAHLVHPQRCYPLRLFAAAFGGDLAARESVAGDVRARRTCLFDPFTSAFYSIVGDSPFSERGLDILHVAGVMCRCDIGNIEASHASLRRIVLKAIQTYPKTMAQAGADFFLLKHRLMEQGPVALHRQSGRPKRQRRRKPRGSHEQSQSSRAVRRRQLRHEQGLSSRAGASSPWKVFWADERKGKPGLPSREELSAMSARYRILPPAAKKDLQARAAQRSAQARALLDSDSKGLIDANRRHQQLGGLGSAGVLVHDASQSRAHGDAQAIAASPGALDQHLSAIVSSAKRRAAADNTARAAKKMRLVEDESRSC